MDNKIRFAPGKSEGRALPEMFNENNYKKVRDFHENMREYEATPLVALDSLASRLGVRGIYIKDESKRFGLNAFKALGGSYAINNIIKRDNPKEPVFVTATDGNHGRGVAWAASRAGARAVVFMPRGTVEVRAEAIRSIGKTHVEITEFNYEGAVKCADAYAKEHGYYLVQDTGFEGYEDIPNDITLGYTTMAGEALRQLGEVPTHVFLQAGVGSMAGGVLGYYAGLPGRTPSATIIEADEAANIFDSVLAGENLSIEGNSETIMAGLNCGAQNIFTWPVLRDFADWFARVPDWITIAGMRKLAHPEGSDEAVVSGESGAVGLGLLLALCEKDEYGKQRKKMGLDEGSIVLLFSTEGDTDPDNYNRIVNE